MIAKRRTISRINIWCIFALLLMCVSSFAADADDSPKNKGFFSKILGRFKKEADAKVKPVVVEDVMVSEDAGATTGGVDDVCTAGEEACSARVVEEQEAEAQDKPPASTDTASSNEDALVSEGKERKSDETEDREAEATQMSSNTTDTSLDESDAVLKEDASVLEVKEVESKQNEEETICKDLHDNCATWADQQDPETNLTPCITRSAYMSTYCPVSCGTCVLSDIDKRLRQIAKQIGQEDRLDGHCTDNNFECANWAKAGECESNSNYMHLTCSSSCEICSADSNFFGSGQRTVNGKSQDLALTKSRIDDTKKYMDMVNNNPEYAKVRDNCLNRNKDCAFWWAVGECTINKEYMDMFCAPSCQTCHLKPGFGSLEVDR